MDSDTQETSDPPADDAAGSGVADGRADAAADGEPAAPGDDGDGAVAEGADTATGEGESGSREVVVPMRVYKTVTVFSTLIAIVAVIAGFVLLDNATNRATASLDEINAVLALAGLGCIVLGAATYAFSTRFRTEGMGKSNDDAAEDSDNG